MDARRSSAYSPFASQNRAARNRATRCGDRSLSRSNRENIGECLHWDSFDFTASILSRGGSVTANSRNRSISSD
ncbi:hypothetical protein ANRL3_01282 [Anaerolineae bacterium]|nr:hypothetical protein ANRL3_01282 [Anaerolineae bacterium]